VSAPGGGGGLDLPPPAAGAALLNPCDEEIGAEDEEEIRFHMRLPRSITHSWATLGRRSPRRGDPVQLGRGRKP
jgi:hypothetical protein